jgi:hypothetical protein
MCAARDQWRGLVDDGRVVDVVVSIRGILAAQSDSRGGSLPFQALGSDGKTYWVKMPHNVQGPRALVSEQIVTACGRLIGAPVCITTLIQIPAEFDGDVLENGTVLRAGISHASLDVANGSMEKHFAPLYREQDDNRRRHAGYFALFDWCWGEDMQWIYDLSADRRTYSHDHGHFLPGGPNWTLGSLEKNVAFPHEIDQLAQGLDQGELVRMAYVLDNLDRETIQTIIKGVPTEWGVAAADLEAVGWFLERRRAGVAQRLRSLAGQQVAAG